MAFTAIIIATFIFPIVVLIMVWSWKLHVRKELERQNRDKTQLIYTLERIVALKNKLINLLKY
jgi:hypothetical protein